MWPVDMQCIHSHAQIVHNLCTIWMCTDCACRCGIKGVAQWWVSSCHIVSQYQSILTNNFITLMCENMTHTHTHVPIYSYVLITVDIAIYMWDKIQGVYTYTQYT